MLMLRSNGERTSVFSRLSYSNCARSHPRQKYQAPYNSLEPTTPLPFHEITSYEEWNDGGQLTRNTVNEIPSQEGISPRQYVHKFDS